ncbi:MAG: cysteine--tRNA ligase [Acidobacteria bacterium RIFCSPLOWO2_02_FULL_67_36]|nr:MAG: cysteine--tRNA ligase [Acidobacteria bacterium RIFCSPLOWO2_02_FULL_67_36]OFW19919.1 MAG: cysteine--tRNA ligase [Acidobacteria bacterium RIFCSPLOWO2_12_FULL_66_21]
MRLYNTLTRSEEEFAPSQDNIVRMYTCGLTVYARGHIGNFRTFVATDVLRRALRHQAGCEVRQVMNFTDVDDRTILESQKAGVPLREYTGRYIDAFRRDAAALGLEPVEENPRATDDENITAMGRTIAALEERGHTYRSDGSIYFKISTLPDYGKLARLDHAGMKSGARIDSDRYEKEDARDFVLWKATKPGEPTWDPGIGAGRPGWHIECSAMALRLLGEPPIDIHAGGVDLIFPHHENEIAQSEGATGRPFSRFWVHVEHLMIEDEGKAAEKMSKSLGNVYNLQDVVDRGFRPSALRYLYLGVHYRKQLRFSWTAMAQAEEALKRLTDFLARLDTVPGRAANPVVAERLAEATRGFAGHIDDDLNTAAALGVIFDLVRALNSTIDAGEMGTDDARAVRETFERFDKVLGVLALRRGEDERPPVPVEEIEHLIAARRAARLARNFAEADRIRQDLDTRGILLEDTGSTTRWKRK